MKIASWNVNGIRAVERKKELDNFLSTYDPDVFFIQEIKAKQEQLSKELTQHPEYVQFYHPAEKPGYAGTGIWIKKSSIQTSEENPVDFYTGMPNFDDNEGRISRIDLNIYDPRSMVYDQFSLLGVYFPNGGKSPEAWDGKLVFYEKFLEYVNSLRKEGKNVVWCGDVNCAHEEIDLARPKDNEKSIGFRPEERAWVTKVIKNEWVDVFRKSHPKKVMYSWWHVITRARLRNIGWRIDYFFIDEKLMSQVENIEYLNNQMGSDHCPVLLKLKN